MNIRLSHRSLGLAMLAATIVLQTGCHRDSVDHSKLQSAADAHRASFTEVDNLRLVTGNSGAPQIGRSADIGDPVYVDETGHKIPKSYYVVYCDIYWRLNWIRLQLKNGTIPEDFTRKLANVRKELREATAGLAHDGNYRVADEALTLLESGWTHYQAHQDLVDAAAHISSAPWSVGSIAMQQFIDTGGLGFGEKSLANSALSPGAPDPTDTLSNASAGGLDSGSTRNLTPAQERAIAVAIRYASDYHREPKECAQADWSNAVQKINRLRDQLWLMNKPNNRDNNSIVDVTGQSSSSSSDPERISNSYSKDGTDLPNVASPTGDPFRLPPPRSATTSDKPRHGDE